MGLPRIRGGGPPRSRVIASEIRSSPHTRGWSGDGVAQRVFVGVFPAYAGVVPGEGVQGGCGGGLPRIRGGGPAVHDENIIESWSSPHTRGWSRSGATAFPYVMVFPAYAGVVPENTACPDCCICLPRIRGGGPHRPGPGSPFSPSSPHTRGWSLPECCGVVVLNVFPAYAGVVPRRRSTRRSATCLPRIRGGGPAWRR